MARIRYNLIPGGLVEVTITTTDRQKLLRPSGEVNAAIRGVIGRAQNVYPELRLHAYVFASTHFHMLVSADTIELVSRFMQHLNSNITDRLNRINQRTGATWAHRYHSIAVSEHEATQRMRLRYLMAHGVKEALVALVADWPCESNVPWLRRGKAIRGTWTSYTALHNAMRNKKASIKRREFETTYTLVFTVLPCWADLSPRQWRKLVRSDISDIEAEAREKAEAAGSSPPGAGYILAADPRERLPSRPRRVLPLAHAPADEFKEVRARFKAVCALYAEASASFASGDFDVDFPAGTFRPLGGFVGARAKAFWGRQADGTWRSTRACLDTDALFVAA